MKNKNSNARCIIVLVAIAVVCVGLLAVLNDLLYIPPDTSVFNKAAAGTYDTEVTIDKNIKVAHGKIELIVKGKLTDGTEVIGLYVTGNKYNKSDSHSIAVVVNAKTHVIVGLFQIKDGSTGGYKYSTSKFYNILDKSLISTDFLNEGGLIQTGATNSSIAVQYTITAAAEYYSAAFVK